MGREYNLDGIDIDIESSPSGATLTKFVAATKALSKYFGPKSGTGKTFVYDTNQNPTNFFIQTAPDTTMYSFRHTEEVQLILQQFPDFMHHTSA
jgi:hypothetical protein